MLTSKQHVSQNGQPGLEDLLITPVQRLPRYKMLLSELLHHTPEGHVDLPNLQNAVRMISSAASQVPIVASVSLPGR